MKRNLVALTAAGAIALGGFVVVQAQPGPGCGGHWHGHAFGLKGIAEKLDLTADQQTKVEPILDAAKPQITAIHQEAMQKMHTVMNSTLSQIWPLLTADHKSTWSSIGSSAARSTTSCSLEDRAPMPTAPSRAA